MNTKGVPDDVPAEIIQEVNDFRGSYQPLEGNNLKILVDERTNSYYCECHLDAESILLQSTIDVPLDPDEQAEYRANRDINQNDPLFLKMIDDAENKRTFSNIVFEFTKSFDPEHPLKVIGGQHRYVAIQRALEKGVNQYHGVKVYFGLDSDQRMDVQVISNTNIDISPDLLDRVMETHAGPNLRNWCQKVGLLEPEQDFADKRQQGPPITVRTARTFIVNYFHGKQVKSEDFGKVKTEPVIAVSGGNDPEWESLKAKAGEGLWQDPGLQIAGKEYAALIKAQTTYFERVAKRDRKTLAYSLVTYNYSVISSWAFVAGVLFSNKKRLSRHFSLKDQRGRDPLNAAQLAEGSHKSDPANYRGIATRTGPKERGRMAELFFAQTDRGEGITKALIDLAINMYQAKIANLEVEQAKAKLERN